MQMDFPKEAYKGFIDLFPTKVHKFNIEPHLINKALINIETNKDEFTYKEVFNHPDYLELQNYVTRYIEAIAPRSERISHWKTVSSWLNNQPSNSKGFGFHNHTDAFLSAVLYLKGSEMSLTFRDEAKEATSTNPCHKEFDIIIRHTWNQDAAISVSVGDLLVFPSHLLHEPNHNQTNENRISIAYNLMPCRNNHPNTPPWSMALNL